MHDVGRDNCTLINTAPLTWAIPENGAITPPAEPATEPGIELDLNMMVTNPSGGNILDNADATGKPCPTTDYPVSCISDQFTAFNTGGHGAIDFFSDPNNQIEPLTGLPVGCVEDLVAGCRFTFTVNTPVQTLFVTLFSDGDFPSPGSSVTSDTLSIATPEPSFGPVLLLLAAGGLFGRLAQVLKAKRRVTS